MPANNEFADGLLSIAKQLMSDGIVNTSQDDVGAPFHLNSINVAYVSSWTRPSNCIMVSLVKDMIPVRNMNLSQILRAGVRSDLPNGQKRLCLSYLIAGLFATAFLVNDCSPVIFDLIPCFKRKQGTTEEDFEEENGSINIKDCHALSTRMIEYTLKNYTKIYAEGEDVRTAFLDYIKEKE